MLIVGSIVTLFIRIRLLLIVSDASVTNLKLSVQVVGYLSGFTSLGYFTATQGCWYGYLKFQRMSIITTVIIDFDLPTQALHPWLLIHYRGKK